MPWHEPLISPRSSAVLHSQTKLFKTLRHISPVPLSSQLSVCVAHSSTSGRIRTVFQNFSRRLSGFSVKDRQKIQGIFYWPLFLQHDTNNSILLCMLLPIKLTKQGVILYRVGAPDKYDAKRMQREVRIVFLPWQRGFLNICDICNLCEKTGLKFQY